MGVIYIDGVSNYCDRWCERCPLTARCLVFAMEQRIEEAGHDGVNAAFWKSLGLEMPEEFDEESDHVEDPYGLFADGNEDDELVRDETTTSRTEHNRHPLAEAGMQYGTVAHRWLREHAEGIAESARDEAGRVSPSEAIDVLRWYSFQVGVKLNRALSERFLNRHADEPKWDTGSDWDADLEHDELVAEAGRVDRDGSAKVALIGIERSFGAWTVLRTAVPEQEAAIREFQCRLARLRRQIDEVLPGARTFIRAGFDDGTISETTD
jgi:hypothetical protein